MLLLLGGGKWLVDGAVGLARRFGLSTLLIGLVVVAFGTSAPELVFNVIAGINGNTDLCLGNIVGSNIANVTLVLGCASIYRGLDVHSRVIQREMPLLLAVSIGMLAMAYAPPPVPGTPNPLLGFARIDGVVLLAGFLGVVWLWYLMARQERADPLVTEAKEETEEDPVASLRWSIALFVVGCVALGAGGKLAEVGAVGIASALGVSQTLIGLTIVGAVTSLPELVTSLIAARRGHGDLAIGNVVGSNLFNILLVLGTTSTIAPVALPSPWGGADMLIMIAVTGLLLPVAITRRHITRKEGVLLVVIYAAFVAFTVVR